MRTVLVNSALIIWISLLLFAPGLWWSTRRQVSALLLAGSAAATLSVICFVTFVVSFSGYGALDPLRVCVVLLFGVLIAAVVSTAKAGQWRPMALARRFGVVILGMGVGIWTQVPPLLELARMHLTFGFATLGNSDIALYSLAAQGVQQAGFRNTNHIANTDIGHFSRHLSYMGPEVLLDFASSATGLPVWKVALASLGVAVCLIGAALYALAESFWPQRSMAWAPIAVVAAVPAFSTYTYGQYFLGAIMVLSSVGIAFAGATRLAANFSPEALVAVVGGGALGIYSYGQIGLPFVFVLPIWTALAAFLCGEHRLRAIWRRVRVAVLGTAGALAMSSLSFALALYLLRAQSQANAGFALSPVSGTSALFWPPGIGQEQSSARIAGTWSLVGLVILVCLIAAWRAGQRGSAAMAGVVAVVAVVIVVVAVGHYGSERYQTWKLESLLLPLVTAVALPALFEFRLRAWSIGRAAVGAALGLVTLGPFLAWQSTPVDHNHYSLQGLVQLSRSPTLRRLSSVNIRLEAYLESMTAGAVIPTPAVSFTALTTFAPGMTSLDTCTLTRKDFLASGQLNYIDLGNGFVLLQEPHACAFRK